jgi:hypothetical protein
MDTDGQGFLGKRITAGKHAWTDYSVSALDACVWLYYASLISVHRCSSVVNLNSLGLVG